MKSFFQTFLEIFKKEKAIVFWMVLNFLASLGVFFVSIFNLEPDSAVVKVGYGDIGGYRDGSWTDMLSFAIIALILGVLHNFIAIRIYEKRGTGITRIFLAMTFAIIALAFVILFRLVGEN